MRKRKPRRAFSTQDKQTALQTTKSIVTPDVADAGKTQPAQGLPGGSSIVLDEEEEDLELIDQSGDKPKRVKIRTDEEGVETLPNTNEGQQSIDNEFQIRKIMALTLEADVMSAEKMIDIHKDLHLSYRKKAANIDGAMSVEDVVNIHSVIVDKMLAQGVEHPPPPDEGLDGMSLDLQEHTEVAVSKDNETQRTKMLDNGEIVTKQQNNKPDDYDPYLDPPRENAEYAFSIQQVWKGMEVCDILRMEMGPKRLALGWELEAFRSETIRKSVTKMKQAKGAMAIMDKFSHIDWMKAQWNTQVISKRKAPFPVAWLDIEGVTPPSKLGGAPSLGGNTKFPGVFCLVEKGKIEYGAQKDGFHEYFVNGTNNKYRVTIAKNQAGQYNANRCEDALPHVLSKEAIEKDWMPRLGLSALPKSIRTQLPKKQRYWLCNTIAKAKSTRNKLYKALESGDVEIDLTLPYKKAIKKANSDHGHYSLQKQTWHKQPNIDTGPDNTIWWLRMDLGKDEIVTLKMYDNPLDKDGVSVDIIEEYHKDALSHEGVIKSAHYLNPAKGYTSNLECLDSGKVRFKKANPDVLEVELELEGNELDGVYKVAKSQEGWVWQPNTEEVIKQLKEYMAENKIEIPIIKQDKDKQIVTGIVLEPMEVDAHNDYIKAEIVEKAAHKFLSTYNTETELGVLHKIFGDNGVELYQSYIAPVTFKIGKQTVKKGSWVMTIHVVSKTLWKKIKDGKITGLSIGGIATVL